MARDLEIEGLAELLSALDAFADGAVDFRRVERPLKALFHATEREQFETQGALSGGWEPLDGDYAKRKQDLYGNAPIEVARGTLMRSLTEDTPESVSEVSKDSALFGTSVDYARFQTRELIPVADAQAGEYELVVAGDAATFARHHGLNARVDGFSALGV